MDLVTWPTENLREEIEAINRDLTRVETYSERVDLRRFKYELQEELRKRGEL